MARALSRGYFFGGEIHACSFVTLLRNSHAVARAAVTRARCAAARVQRAGAQREVIMKRIALVLLLLVACSHATPPPPPQDTQLQMPGLIRGTVIAKDGSVLPGVTVVLDGRAMTVTDAQGGFRFLSVPPGKHAVVAQLAGYGQGTRVVTISASTGIQTSVVLNPSVSESIVVTAQAPMHDVPKTGSVA
jgi:hypothetical protein